MPDSLLFSLPLVLFCPPGIGQGRVTDNLKGAPIDDSVFISDERSVEMTFRLLHEEGISVGASSGLNVVAAYDVGGEWEKKLKHLRTCWLD